MDEIRALQRQLAAIQEAPDSLKLSERNVIDLVTKLQRLGKIDLIYTLNAKAMLTPAHLQQEISDQLLMHMGRVSLADLSAATNVDLSYIERACDELAAVSSGSHRVTVLGAEVLTEWYLDGIMEDANEILQEHGYVTMGDLAQQYGFAVDFMESVVAARLGPIIRAHARGNMLYTEAYVARQVAQIRGIFSAITRPTTLPEIVAAMGLDERLMTETVADLIATEALRGTLRGREYVPHAFLDAQRAAADGFFASNGYLFHSQAAQLHLPRPFEFLKRSFPDAIALSDAVVSGALLAQLDAAVDAACLEASWVDGRTVLPPALTDRSVAELLALCTAMRPQKPPPVVVVARVYAASRAFLGLVHDKFAEHAATQAAIAAFDAVQRKTQAKPSTTTEGKSAGTKSSKSKAMRQITETSIAPSAAAMADLVGDWFDDCADDEAFVDGVVAELRPQGVYDAALAKALSAIHRGGSTTKQELDALFEDRFDGLYVRLLCFQKGATKLATLAPASSVPVEDHALETTALALCNLVLSYVKAAHEVDLRGVAALTTEDDEGTVVANLEAANLSLLEKHTTFAPEIAAMWALAVGPDRSLSGFVTHLGVLAVALNMPLRKCDRKKERADLAAFKSAVLRRFQDAPNDPRVLVALATQALVLAATGLAVSLPSSDALPSVFPAIAAALKSSGHSEHLATLEDALASEDPLSAEVVDDLYAVASKGMQ
ncbi:hypothetical protein ACHHYP_06593 [Achlya hypogyna]|uniref:E3 UFM1-protein ligase 1-like N-terminal domain-containing protein n=1 Tax=Achlya hypogyna TaxID=1202772 RepID=A0A1V9YSZ8_ACHHY|nr:hypothetical protein ACHHYP_06593 [Achlya hypogyna]